MARGGSRPGAGRKPTDPALKRLMGTTRADRQVELGDEVPLGAMIAPLHLGDLEQLTFDSIAKMLEQQNRASPHFTEHVALLAVRLAQIQRLKAVLEMEGDTFTSETIRGTGKVQVITKMVRARPEAAMLSDAMRQAQSLLGELMLNPASAMKLATADSKPAEDGFDAF